MELLCGFCYLGCCRPRGGGVSQTTNTNVSPPPTNPHATHTSRHATTVANSFFASAPTTPTATIPLTSRAAARNSGPASPLSFFVTSEPTLTSAQLSVSAPPPNIQSTPTSSQDTLSARVIAPPTPSAATSHLTTCSSTDTARTCNSISIPPLLVDTGASVPPIDPQVTPTSQTTPAAAPPPTTSQPISSNTPASTARTDHLPLVPPLPNVVDMDASAPPPDPQVTPTSQTTPVAALSSNTPISTAGTGDPPPVPPLSGIVAGVLSPILISDEDAPPNPATFTITLHDDPKLSSRTLTLRAPAPPAAPTKQPPQVTNPRNSSGAPIEAPRAAADPTKILQIVADALDDIG